LNIAIVLRLTMNVKNTDKTMSHLKAIQLYNFAIDVYDMASNAAFSQETKKLVVFHCKNGENIRLLAKYNDVPLSVAQSWILELAEMDKIGRERP